VDRHAWCQGNVRRHVALAGLSLARACVRPCACVCVCARAHGKLLTHELNVATQSENPDGYR
jgi:hypothetical protein